ncbi:ABC transporter substrate-binding protein [Streptomyces sp. B1866]|uniref:ABC transporter substrate-binding protein n=1 Tax=Streptomyces sp. B1866 TaxID=3075431 RepID=UPI00288D039C|nr:extracellular solute-binding protein [Streptomyces sp. B1866]MDT3395750.1 ABC transporter substrate-binding protein [Streptomyces sp. B1866]
MSSFFSRRQALAASAGAALGATALGGSLAGGAAAAPSGRPGLVREETRSLDELYRDALAEGGDLLIYAGGDTADQQDYTRDAFLKRFPRMKVKIIVDYSKFHDVRLDTQFATDTLVPDVVQLQTVQDFPRWKEQGRLLCYKPAGFSAVHDGFKDRHGAWVAVEVYTFSFLYDAAAVGGTAPSSPEDLVDPRWKGRIASSYPQDDDAILFLYRLYAQRYGWDWIARLAAQGIEFGRGTNSPGDAVGAKRKAIGIGSYGTLTAPSTDPVKWVAAGGHPFMAWGQRAAILKGAKHPAAARLYLNWHLSAEKQRTADTGWSVRTDVAPVGGLKPVWEYPDAHVEEFPRFMADRAEAERWRQTFALYFGEVKGAPSPGRLGLHPGR